MAKKVSRALSTVATSPTASVCKVTGTIPIGIANGERTAIIAAPRAIRVNEYNFVFCIPSPLFYV